jgi:D-alanyl-D-alanine carboxypeptidase
MMPAKRLLMLLMLPLLASLPAHTFAQAELRQLHEELDLLVSASTQGKDNQEYLNAVVLLDSPQHSFTFRGASGFAQARTPMTPDHQFYIESITKTFTATIVLQLAEEGRLGPKGLEATLGDLEVFPPEVLDQLHRIEDRSYGSSITVDQLVRHRTGMKNFTYDDENGRVADYPDQSFAPNSLLGLFANDPVKGLAGLLSCAREHLPEGTDPARHIGDHGIPEECDRSSYYFFSPPFEHWDYGAWKKDPNDRLAGLLNFYLSGMNQTALFPPGEEFAYTDTNYLVLGLLIEKVTGNSLHSELRRRIFGPLKMGRTYMSYATDPSADGYQKKLSELWALGLPIVKLGVNRSMMWTDAGIVSTVDDLNAFIRALAAGRLFKDESTLETMLTLPAGEKKGYGRGIGVDRTTDDMILFHGGGAASLMIYQTKADISFIGTMNDATAGGRQRLGKVHGGFQKALGEHGIEIRSPF